MISVREISRFRALLTRNDKMKRAVFDKAKSATRQRSKAQTAELNESRSILFSGHFINNLLAAAVCLPWSDLTKVTRLSVAFISVHHNENIYMSNALITDAKFISHSETRKIDKTIGASWSFNILSSFVHASYGLKMDVFCSPLNTSTLRRTVQKLFMKQV